MRKFKYVGPHDAVDLQGVGVVEQGATVDVEDPDLASGLDGQADWEHVPVKKAASSDKED